MLIREAKDDPEHAQARGRRARPHGAVIGSGIFVIIGEAIGDAGPSIIISFALAGVTCLFSAFSYGELTSTIPVAGSTHTYSYATLGELVAWIIGWDLIARVRGRGRRGRRRLGRLREVAAGLRLRDHHPHLDRRTTGRRRHVQRPPVFLVLAVAALLMYGVRASARANTVMVTLKIAILVLFVVVGVGSISGDNFSPWAPSGFSGTVDAVALIFFAYIGFAAISTSEEAENPSRDPRSRSSARCSSAR